MLWTIGLPQWLSSREFSCNAGDSGSFPELGNPLEKAVDPVFLPGEPVNRGAWRVQPVGLQSQTGLK